MARRRTVKWAHLYEIDYRTRVGTPAWYANNHRLARKLSAWRYLHILGNGHKGVRKEARKRKIKPSSNMSTPRMLKIAREMGGQVGRKSR